MEFLTENSVNNEASSSNASKTPGKLIASGKTSSALKTPKSASNLFGKSARTPLTPRTLESPARIAKELSTQARLQKVAQLKEKWAREKEAKQQLHQQYKTMSMQKLQEDTIYAAEMRKKNAEKQREFKEREKQQRKDQLASSLETRTQLAKDLDAQAKAKRRISVFLNQKMRSRALQKEAQLKEAEKEHEVSLLASRRLDHLETRQAKKMEEENRRESLMNRTLRAHELKKKAEELEQQAKAEEASLLELRKMNWQDEVQTKQSAEKSRRESIANRINSWRVEKQLEQQQLRKKEEEELDLLQTRAIDWQEVQSYKSELEQRKRESLAFRLDKWREEKSHEVQQKEQEQLAREMEIDLNRQANEDVERYRDTQKQSRRQSLAYRLDKAKKDHDYDLGQKALQQMVDEEEKRLADLDRQDIQNYRQKILDARRQSLEYRNQTEYQERMRQEGEAQATRLAETADRELREEAWRDVQRYREQQRAEARKSLAWRIADAHRKHEIELAMHEEQLNRMHLDLQCRREDWLSLQEYKKEESARRRKSIAMRLDSWKQHRVAEEKELEKKEMMAEEDAILREMDREELFATKLAQDMMARRNMLSSDMIH